MRLRNRFTSRTSKIAIGALAVLTATAGFGMVTAPAAHAGSNGTVLYEVDCGGTGAAAGNTAPFIVGLTMDAAPHTSFPSGASFGATGAFSVVVSAAFLANIEANLDLSTGALDLGASNIKIGSPDGTATGSYSYSKASFGPQSLAGLVNQVTGVTWVGGTNQLSGPFAASDAGKFVAAPLGNNNLGQGLVIGAVLNPGPAATAVLSGNTAATQATGVTVGLATAAGLTYTDAAVSTGNVFTTNGSAPNKSNIGLAGNDGSTNGKFTVILPVLGGIDFGGTALPTGPACVQTGYDAGGNPSTPAPAIAPYALYQAAGIANLTSVGPSVFAPSSFVNLAINPPVAGAQAVNLGVGGSKTVTLNASPGANPGAPTPPAVASCTLVPGSISDARLGVVIDNTPNVCSAHLTDTGSGVGLVTFDYTATDNASPSIGGPTTGSAGTVTVTIGTPPVDQQINQDVNAGQLVLSCNSPAIYVPGSALTTCPLLTIPAITLNGLQQTTHINANTIYVSDNRGDPAVGWDLSTYMVTTPSNPNSNCATATDFCNSSVGSHVSNPNGHIASGNLSLTGVTCGVFTGNLNVAPTADAGAAYSAAQGLCHAAAGISGGTFTFGGQFNLVIPSSVYAGTYMGTVEYLVS